MSRRPQAESRPGFVKVCLCPEIRVTAGGKIVRRDLTNQCDKCGGFAALERCSDCEDRGGLNSTGKRILKLGKRATYCETCKNRGYRRTDRKYDAYAERPKDKKPKKKRKR